METAFEVVWTFVDKRGGYRIRCGINNRSCREATKRKISMLMDECG